MRIVDMSAFERNPIGAMVLGRQWVYGTFDERLYCSIVFGAVDELILEPLMRLWRVELNTTGHLSLCDCSLVTSVTPQAFAALTQFLGENNVSFARTVERQALVRPAGLTGAVIAGYYRVFPPPYANEIFDQRADALRWLGLPVDAVAPADAYATIDPLLGQLRSHLGAHPGERSLERVARALALSSRSLQRRLAMLDTSFGKEVNKARIEQAMRLLTTSEKKLSDIARVVGCASPQTFNRLFRREVGVTPAMWRQIQRRAST
jgi:AraC-like DNA-binding protein